MSARTLAEERRLLRRALVMGAVIAVSLASSAYGQSVELKPQIQARGPAVTLGDVFVDAGSMSGRAVAPAPAPGGRSTFSAHFLAAAASAAGLSWTPPQGLNNVVVTRAGGARVEPASFAVAAPAIKRGEIVTLVYVAPGLQLTTRAKALADAGIGESVRLVNLQSNRQIDAVATGAGVASANGAQSF